MTKCERGAVIFPTLKTDATDVFETLDTSIPDYTMLYSWHISCAQRGSAGNATSWATRDNHVCTRVKFRLSNQAVWNVPFLRQLLASISLFRWWRHVFLLVLRFSSVITIPPLAQSHLNASPTSRPNGRSLVTFTQSRAVRCIRAAVNRTSGVPRRVGGGVQTPLRNSEGPPKSC